MMKEINKEFLIFFYKIILFLIIIIIWFSECNWMINYNDDFAKKKYSFYL